MADGDKFKYAVEVTPTEGEAITSAWVDVKVVDAAAITQITKLQLSNKSTVINANEVGVEVVALEALNAGGKTITENLPAVESVTSSDVTILYADADKTLTARKAGTVTLTVKFVGVEKTSTLTVEVKAAQAAKKISEATVKTSLANPTIQFKTLDADGKPLAEPAASANTLAVAVKDSKGVVVGSGLTSKTATDFVTGEAYGAGESGITAAGTYTVEVTADTTKIGTYTLEVIDTTAEVADEYKILTDDKKNSAELDVNTVGQTTVTVTAYAKGVALGTNLDLSDTTAFEVKSSNQDVVAVAVNGSNKYQLDLTAGTKTGAATITLSTVSADYKEAVATFTVTVKNTTPQVTSLVLKDETDPIVLSESDIADVATNLNNIKTAIVAKVQSNLETFTAAMIDSVEVTTQEVVIVTITAANGGLEVALPFTKTDDVAPEADTTTPITKNVAGAVYATDDTLTIKFSEAVDVSKITLTNLTLSGGHVWTDATADATVQAVDEADGYATTFTITLGTNTDVAAADTITITSTNVEDKAGNTAANDVTFTVPTI